MVGLAEKRVTAGTNPVATYRATPFKLSALTRTSEKTVCPIGAPSDILKEYGSLIKLRLDEPLLASILIRRVPVAIPEEPRPSLAYKHGNRVQKFTLTQRRASISI